MLTLKNLSFKYHSNLLPVLSNINLQINPGEKVLIVGKNGAGKSTLSKVLSGLIPGEDRGVMDGEYYFEGKDIRAWPRKEIVRKISILFQDFEAQLVCSSVKEEMLFYLMNLGADFHQAEAVAIKISRQFNMTELLGRDIHELSGGEKQKIALFCLLTINPAVLILDEPFTDIEPASQKNIADFLGSDTFGGALILFEQSLDYFRHFSRIVILHNGEILYNGDTGVVCKRNLLEKAGLDVPGPYKVFQCNAPVTVSEVQAKIWQLYEFDDTAYTSVKNEVPKKSIPVLEVKDLCFKYKGQPNYVLENIDLDVQQGDFLAMLGPNGSGKTTLTKCIAGILKPTRGTIYYRGQKVKAGDIGYVYQNPDSQIFAETAFDEVAFSLRMRGRPENEIRDKVKNVLAIMGLGGKSGIDPFTLPKGDRQKVACASILVAEPEVIILDEPTTGLDFPSLNEMMNIIKDLNKRGKTILMITHSMEAAASFGNTICVVNAGAILFHGPSRAFFADEKLLSMAKASRTDIMDLSIQLNGKLLLNTSEFSQCWKAKRP
jgi:ATPase components of various ABC-type transport systems, contain duplicated ATPase